MSTFARVKVLLDIEVQDSWGDDCKVEQIRKQATESALGAIRQGLIVDGTANYSGVRPSTEARVVGTPTVTMVLVERDGVK